MRALCYFHADVTLPKEDPASETAIARRFRAYCAEKRHTDKGVFQDDTAGNDRPAFKQMVDHIRTSGLAYLVVIPNVTHLGSQFEEQVERILRLDSLSCQVICDDSVTSDPLQAALKALNNKASTNERRERIVAGMRAKAAKGLGLGKTPFGYRIGAEGVLEPVAEEAKVVRGIYKLYLNEGIGVRSIARLLNKEGYQTRRGAEWSMVTVRDILRNHAYIGTYRRFGLRIPGSYRAIVSADEFKRVQDRMQSRSPAKRRPRSEPFLLSGILYCGHCGQRMMGVTRRQTWKRKDGDRMRGEYRYYQCQSRTNRSQCEYRTQRATPLEEQVLRQVGGQSVEGILVSYMPVAERVADDSAREQAKVEMLNRRFVDWVKRTASGAMTLPQLRRALTDVVMERRGAVSRLESLDGDDDGMQQAHDEVRGRFDEQWDQLDPSQRREVLHGLVARVEVTDGKVGMVMRG